MSEYTAPRRLAAEFLGTFWLVFAGCGSAVLAASFVSEPDGFASGIGFTGVSIAFGLSVVTMAYAVGHVSGGHFNPAVTVGLAAAGRFAWREVAPYVVTQVVAAVVAAAVLFVVASGQEGFSVVDSGFATNGYGDRSPGGYSLLAVVVAEVVLTAFFLYVIVGATDTLAPRGFAPLAIGLSLTLIHLVSIPVDNTSLTPPGLRVRRCSRAPRHWRSCGCSGWLRSSAPRSPDSATRRCSVGKSGAAHWKRPARRDRFLGPTPRVGTWLPATSERRSARTSRLARITASRAKRSCAFSSPATSGVRRVARRWPSSPTRPD